MSLEIKNFPQDQTINISEMIVDYLNFYSESEDIE